MFNFLCLIVDGKPEKLCQRIKNQRVSCVRIVRRSIKLDFLSGKLYILFSSKEHNLTFFAMVATAIARKVLSCQYVSECVVDR